MNIGKSFLQKTARLAGTAAGILFRILPFFLRRRIAILKGRVLRRLPGMLYGIDYPCTDALIKQLFFGRGEYVPVLFEIRKGVTMELNIAEKTQRLIFLGRPYEGPLTRFVESYLKNGRTFFDVGAHQGYYTLLAASLVGPLGVVVAFEPELRNFEKLKKNIERNGFDGRVHVEKQAVGGETGTITLHLNPLNDGGASINAFQVYRDSGVEWSTEKIHRTFGDATLHEEVPITTLDAWSTTAPVKVKPDLIKIDVEGAELATLRGMSALIREARPHILVEIAEFTTAHQQFLEEYQYRLARITERGIPEFVTHPMQVSRGNYLLAPVS